MKTFEQYFHVVLFIMLYKVGENSYFRKNKITNVCWPILASNSWSVDSATVGVVKNRTNMNSSVLISTALAHQLSWSTDKCSQMTSPATGALATFQWSEKIFLDTDDSGLPCFTVLKSLRHLQKQHCSIFCLLLIICINSFTNLFVTRKSPCLRFR